MGRIALGLGEVVKPVKAVGIGVLMRARTLGIWRIQSVRTKTLARRKEFTERNRNGIVIKPGIWVKHEKASQQRSIYRISL